MMRSTSTLSASGMISLLARAAPRRFHDGRRFELQAVAGEGKCWMLAAGKRQPIYDFRDNSIRLSASWQRLPA